MKERTTPTWTIWAVVLVALVGGVVPGASADLDLGVCQSTCSAVPQDLWPYCCETHHTCCEEFADSCIHDCLPRVSSGDVSAVEERPGLCCALYNLCCFRETPRISSIRNQDIQAPQSFPITHRFSTLPGGPGRNRQSSAPVPQTPQIPQATAPEPARFSKPQVNNDNRRPTSVSRPKPVRNPQSSFRDTPRPETREEVFENRDTSDNTVGHRFALQDPTTTEPSPFQDSQKQEREESNAFIRPQNPNRSLKLVKLARPTNLTPTSETEGKTVFDSLEPVVAKETTITPKTLERPRPGSLFRPTNPRQVNKPEPKVAEALEQESEPEQIKPTRPSLLNRAVQQRRVPSSNPSVQAIPEEDADQPQPKEEKRTNKLIRTGPLIRSGVNRENPSTPSVVTEQPEQAPVTEAENPRGPKLLRPKIKPFRPGKKDSDSSDVLPQKDQEDQLVSDSNLNQQTLNTDSPALLKVDDTPELPKKPTEPKAVVNSTPIRKIKLIRPRENNKTPQSKNQEQVNSQNEPDESLKVPSDTVTVPPAAQPQVSRGRTRHTQVSSTSRSRGAQGRTNTDTQGNQRRTRGRTQSTPDTSVDSTQGTARGTSRSQSTQDRSRGSASRSRGRSRSRSRPVVTETAETVQPEDTEETNVLVHEPEKFPAPVIKTEEMLKEDTEASTDAPIMLDKTMESKKEMEKVMKDDAPALFSTGSYLPTEAPLVTEETPITAVETKPELEKSHEPNEKLPEDLNAIETEMKKQTEEETVKVADQLSALGQTPELVPSARHSSQPEASNAVAEPEFPRVALQPQITRETSQPQIPRIALQPQAPAPRITSQPQATTQIRGEQFTREPLEPQEVTRQRSSSTQTATRQRTSPTPGQTATRSRGRLTARDRLALAN